MVKEWGLVVCHTTMGSVEQVEILLLDIVKRWHMMQWTIDKLVVEEILTYLWIMEVSFIPIDLIINLREVLLALERKESALIKIEWVQNLHQVNVWVILPMEQAEMDILRKLTQHLIVFKIINWDCFDFDYYLWGIVIDLYIYVIYRSTNGGFYPG